MVPMRSGGVVGLRLSGLYNLPRPSLPQLLLTLVRALLLLLLNVSECPLRARPRMKHHILANSFPPHYTPTTWVQFSPPCDSSESTETFIHLPKAASLRAGSQHLG